MPIREFQCEKCGYIFEEIQLTSEPLKISSYCPVCKEKGIKSIAKKIMSRVGFLVNGYNASNGYSRKK